MEGRGCKQRLQAEVVLMQVGPWYEYLRPRTVVLNQWDMAQP